MQVPYTFTYDVNIHFVLNRAELMVLNNAAILHYDGKCKAAGMVGGFIYGWNNLLNASDEDSILVCCSFAKLDLMCKIMEQSGVPDYSKYRQMLAALKAESVRMDREEGR